MQKSTVNREEKQNKIEEHKDLMWFSQCDQYSRAEKIYFINMTKLFMYYMKNLNENMYIRNS